jgi:hypothetical protein
MIMKYRKKENLTDSLAFILSLAIHGLLLLGAYYLTMYHGARGGTTPYKIELDLQTFHEVLSPSSQEEATDKSDTIEEVPSPIVTEAPIAQETISVDAAAPTVAETNPHTINEESEKNSIPKTDSKEEPTIDKRGLYKSAEHKKTGASLELVGWIWDSAPQPQDNTDEIGKIVFEVTIDDAGEIIAIKTLEKTVSPLVEQLYKDEVAKLTFSKTNKNMSYTPTSIGKITFILQYK